MVKQKYYGASYDEPRSDDRNYIIEKSIDDALYRIGKKIVTNDIFFNLHDLLDDYYVESNYNKLFIIEDTSVVINSLSAEKEYPGVDVKYWMKSIDFKTLNKILLECNNDRSAYVRSDIILYLNKKMRDVLKTESKYKIFTGITYGSIISKERKFSTNIIHPWLDNKSFNKWFVPRGEELPLGMLDINNADKHDFRKKAFCELYKFLVKMGFVTTTNDKIVKISDQMHFDFLCTTKILIICGYPCSGKTTLGLLISESYDYYHIEASDFMYLSMYNLNGVNGVDIGEFASKALANEPDIVVDQVLSEVDKFKNDSIVITGFRSLDEIKLFQKKYQGNAEISVAFIEADQIIRFKRSIDRSRMDSLKTFEEFCNRDKQQRKMGIDRIESFKGILKINNNNSIFDYKKKIIDTFNLGICKNYDCKILQLRPKDLESTILLTLISCTIDDNSYFTTTEIANMINIAFKNDKLKTSKNNVSRYFNQNFHPYYELILENNKLKYKLSQTGKSLARKLMRSAAKQEAS